MRRARAFLFPAMLALSAFVATGGLQAARQAEQAEAAGADIGIPFVNHGGIRDWRADGRDAIYLQDRRDRWYRATLMTSCTDLPFAETIGFETRGPDTFDRFSSIVVRGQRCPVETLTRSDPPPGKAKQAKDAGKG
jgi:hypothetical protein